MSRYARALQQILHRRRHSRSRRSLKIREYRNQHRRRRRRAARIPRPSRGMPAAPRDSLKRAGRYSLPRWAKAQQILELVCCHTANCAARWACGYLYRAVTYRVRGLNAIRSNNIRTRSASIGASNPAHCPGPHHAARTVVQGCRIPLPGQVTRPGWVSNNP